MAHRNLESDKYLVTPPVTKWGISEAIKEKESGLWT
jgi:hypothetical protein